jgi:hypothetical protein
MRRLPLPPYPLQHYEEARQKYFQLLCVVVHVMEAGLTKLRNDWTKDQSGGNYKGYFSGQARKDERSEAELLDTDRGELENLFSRLIDEAKQKKTKAKK